MKTTNLQKALFTGFLLTLGACVVPDSSQTAEGTMELVGPVLGIENNEPCLNPQNDLGCNLDAMTVDGENVIYCGSNFSLADQKILSDEMKAEFDEFALDAFEDDSYIQPNLTLTHGQGEIYDAHLSAYNASHDFAVIVDDSSAIEITGDAGFFHVGPAVFVLYKGAPRNIAFCQN